MSKMYALMVAGVFAFGVSDALAHNTGWRSGVRNNGAAAGFAGWRGTELGVVSGWIQWRGGWSSMLAYASGKQPRTLRARSSNVSLGHALFPAGGSLGACVAGDYDGNQREIARRLVVNGVGDAEIRLGWEASGNWFPWTAVGRSASDWKECFTRIAKIFKSESDGFRIAWHMAKRGGIDATTIYPEDDAVISTIGISHYDDKTARFGTEMYRGGPWGLQAWADFAVRKGKKLELSEWGVGRRGDNPSYIQNMHDFLERNADEIAHEAYFNTGDKRLYPVGPNPKSSALYQELF